MPLKSQPRYWPRARLDVGPFLRRLSNLPAKHFAATGCPRRTLTTAIGHAVCYSPSSAHPILDAPCRCRHATLDWVEPLNTGNLMNALMKTALAMVTVAIATQAAAEIILYEHDRFQGRSFTTQRQIGNFERAGFNDRASSVMVLGDRWEVCDDVRFSGRCVVLRPGRYPSLSAMGLNDRVSSVRAVRRDTRIDDDRYAPAPTPVYDSRRRRNERLFEANVTSVRAVVGPPEQRCWVEREQVVQDQRSSNVPAAIAGAVIGGILGHQVGGGRGKDLATVGGAIAGGAVGANVGRSGGAPQPTSHLPCLPLTLLPPALPGESGNPAGCVQ